MFGGGLNNVILSLYRQLIPVDLTQFRYLSFISIFLRKFYSNKICDFTPNSSLNIKPCTVQVLLLAFLSYVVSYAQPQSPTVCKWINLKSESSENESVGIFFFSPILISGPFENKISFIISKYFRLPQC